VLRVLSTSVEVNELRLSLLAISSHKSPAFLSPSLENGFPLNHVRGQTSPYNQYNPDVIPPWKETKAVVTALVTPGPLEAEPRQWSLVTPDPLEAQDTDRPEITANTEVNREEANRTYVRWMTGSSLASSPPK
jgi:hypothetical protein